MSTMKRNKTKYPGVFFIIGKSPVTGKDEKIFYIRYHKLNENKKWYYVEEKAGRQSTDDMTAARAATIRGKRMEGKEDSNRAKRNKAFTFHPIPQTK